MRSPGGFVAVLAVVALAGFAVFTAGAASPAPHSERALLTAINEARTSRGLRPLRLDARLETAARAHSTEMLRYGYFAHGAFGRRLSSFGVRGAVIGENLAWGKGFHRRAGAIVGEGLRRPQQRAHLLRPR